tara:strand:+ start:806 stop:1177 length:372 start_codon:yes stop_codon:yes gene_type:complete
MGLKENRMIITIQERNEALIQRLKQDVRDTPISGGFSILAKLLVDQGLADTRASSIDDAFIGGTECILDYRKLTSAILNCDGSNFPWLLKIAPRLMLICLEAQVNPALIERLESVLVDQKEAS